MNPKDIKNWTNVLMCLRLPFQESRGHHQLMKAYTRANEDAERYALTAHADRRADDAVAVRMEMTSGGGGRP